MSGDQLLHCFSVTHINKAIHSKHNFKGEMLAQHAFTLTCTNMPVA